MKNPTATVDRSAAVQPQVEGPANDRRTRDRVAQLLLESGPATAGALAGRVGLTSAAVRRHLDAMVADGMVTEGPARLVRGHIRGRGRPARVFALTPAGRSAFPHAYDEIATAALRFLAESAGEQAVVAFAERTIGQLETRYRPVVESAAPERRAEALAAALSADGYAASTTRAGFGVQLCQHHCPVQQVAAAFPQLCEAETAVFGRLLGSHVQRLATLAHGDGVCTTHIPMITPATAPGRTSA